MVSDTSSLSAGVPAVLVEFFQAVVGFDAAFAQQVVGAAPEDFLENEMIPRGEAGIERYGGTRPAVRLNNVGDAVEYPNTNDGHVPFNFMRTTGERTGASWPWRTDAIAHGSRVGIGGVIRVWA